MDDSKYKVLRIQLSWRPWANQHAEYLFKVDADAPELTHEQVTQWAANGPYKGKSQKDELGYVWKVTFNYEALPKYNTWSEKDAAQAKGMLK